MITADRVAHSWDLARATGLTIEIPTATAEIALATTRASVTPEFRAAGLYVAEQPAREDAAPLDRLAAFSGRSL